MSVAQFDGLLRKVNGSPRFHEEVYPEDAASRCGIQDVKWVLYFEPGIWDTERQLDFTQGRDPAAVSEHETWEPTLCHQAVAEVPTFGLDTGRGRDHGV